MTDEGNLNRSSRRRRLNVKQDIIFVENTVVKGGRLDVLSSDDQDKIHSASLELLCKIGRAHV